MVQPTSLEKLIVVALKASPASAKKGWTIASTKSCARAHRPNQARARPLGKSTHPSAEPARRAGRC